MEGMGRLMKKVIITGANGFIGSSMIKKFVDKNIEVVALDISFANDHLPASNLITRIETDLSSAQEILNKIPSVDDYDCFYHLAWRGVNGPEKADSQIQTKNIEMVMNCAKAAKELNCGKFLCAGTVAENAVFSLNNLENTSGGMMYGVAKYCAHLMLEDYCKNIGLKFVWMQFSNIYGPANKTGNLVSYTLDTLARNEEATFGPAAQMYDFIYVEDLIEAACRLGESDTKSNFYFIGSGKARMLKDYLLEIGEKLGKKDLIKIGARPDDGIKYSSDMFDTSNLSEDIGDYVSKDFSEGIQYTIDNF